MRTTVYCLAMKPTLAKASRGHEAALRRHAGFDLSAERFQKRQSMTAPVVSPLVPA